MEENSLFPTLHRRDMFGERCLVCGLGSYIYAVNGIMDVLECSMCEDFLDRWMTKKEVLQHICNTRLKVFDEGAKSFEEEDFKD